MKQIPEREPCTRFKCMANLDGKCILADSTRCLSRTLVVDKRPDTWVRFKIGDKIVDLNKKSASNVVAVVEELVAQRVNAKQKKLAEHREQLQKVLDQTMTWFAPIIEAAMSLQRAYNGNELYVTVCKTIIPNTGCGWGPGKDIYLSARFLSTAPGGYALEVRPAEYGAGPGDHRVVCQLGAKYAQTLAVDEALAYMMSQVADMIASHKSVRGAI